MSDPISSSALQSAGPTYDPYADEVGQMSRADAPNSSQAQPQGAGSQASPATSSPATAKLVSSVPPPLSALPPTASTPPANNNAQRTTALDGVKPYASAGTTSSGSSVYAGVALLKGRDRSGAEVEVLSASGQVGAQSELQVGLQRVSGTRGSLTGSVDAFTARAQIGTQNDDGSTGFNIGATATAIGLEGTAGGATSATYGVGAGVGLAGSVGVRDVDGDGKTEACLRASFGPVTVGVCVEDPR